MGTTPDLGIPELTSGQALPDITHNEALVLVQALLNGVVDKDLTAPPVSPTEGDAYLINTASPTGAWTGHGYCIAIYWGGSWRFVPGNNDSGTPLTMGARQEGLSVYVRDEDARYTWRGTGSPVAFAWGVASGIAAASISFTATDRLLGRDTAGAGTGEEISVGGGIEFTGAGAIRTGAFTGDVTKTAGGTALTIAANAVTDAKFRQSAALSVVGRSANTTGDVADIAAGTDGHVLRRSGTALGFGTLAAGAFAANTAPLSTLANAGAQFDIVGRKTSSGGAWEDCTRAQLELAVTNSAGNTYLGPQTINAGSGTSPSTAGYVLRSDDAGALGPFFITFHNSASPAASDTIGGFVHYGRNSTPADFVYANWQIQIDDPNAGSEDARFVYLTTIAGSRAIRWSLGAGQFMAGATGGDMGAGTINATAVYDDGVLLCAPLHADDPNNTQEFWDSLVPNRTVMVRAEEFEYVPAVVRITPAVKEVVPAVKRELFDIVPARLDPLTAEVIEPEQRIKVGEEIVVQESERIVEPERKEIVSEAFTRLVKPAEYREVVTEHRTARRYFDMVAEGFDPSDPQAFFDRMEKDRAVPGMPTLAEHEQRYPVVDGVRTVADKYSVHERTERMALALDFMALTIRTMYERIKVLEAAK